MPSIIKTAATLAYLATAALANPINAGPAGMLRRQHWTDCEAGLVFYSCANGYRGCYEKDPCALPPLTTTTTTTVPLPTPTPITTTPAACPTGSIWQPTMYNLYPTDPTRSEAAVTRLDITTLNSPTTEQAMVFHGIPAGATRCTLHWAQAGAAERTFVVEHSGLVSVAPLTGFPAAGSPVSIASLAPFAEADDAAGAAFDVDFTFWDATLTATDHVGSPVACAESVYLKVGLDATNGAGHVLLEQDARNGFYIEYEC
ncbi:hypothetical protein GGR54DRAFT_91930 [Hypoxylon sp. NC1633]|nr:hypothetical protein GGR54DRAFT_91930 [Hypoxylon sp. NC1633]